MRNTRAFSIFLLRVHFAVKDTVMAVSCDDATPYVAPALRYGHSAIDVPVRLTSDPSLYHYPYEPTIDRADFYDAKWACLERISRYLVDMEIGTRFPQMRKSGSPWKILMRRVRKRVMRVDVYYNNELPPCYNWDKPQGAAVLWAAGLLPVEVCGIIDKYCCLILPNFDVVAHVVDKNRGVFPDYFTIRVEEVTLECKSLCWFVGDKLHRQRVYEKCGPAVISCNQSAWYMRGKRHLMDGRPAQICTVSPSETRMGIYYHDDRRIASVVFDNGGRVASATFTVCHKDHTKYYADDERPTIEEFGRSIMPLMFCDKCHGKDAIALKEEARKENANKRRCIVSIAPEDNE